MDKTQVGWPGAEFRGRVTVKTISGKVTNCSRICHEYQRYLAKFEVKRFRVNLSGAIVSVNR